MSDYFQGLSTGYAPASALASGKPNRASGSNSSLDMTDFLQLMVAQFQNQSIDDTASTTDMLNQLVQISVVQAITNITDATIMTYAGSLVGKEVTVARVNDKGVLEEVVGTVTGTGSYGGQQVVFVDGESYYLSEIMAVGRLPKVEEPENPDKPDAPEGGGTEDKTET